MRVGTIARADGSTVAARFTDDGVAPVERFADAGELLRAGDEGLAAAEHASRCEPFDPSRIRLPILEPRAVICVGHNFRTHVLELGRELPAHPTYFAKLTSSLIEAGRAVRLPAISESVDYEGEVAVVIGSSCREMSAESAALAIAGYVLANDVSMRDFQRRTTQWFAGKNFGASTPVGPWIVTADEAGDSTKITFDVTVNGELRQHGDLADLIFPVHELIADLSRFLTLEPGDLILTGTPGGVGDAFAPPCYLRAGDVVEVRSDRLGLLSTRFIS